MTQSYRINQLTKVTVLYDSNCSCVSSIGALILNKLLSLSDTHVFLLYSACAYQSCGRPSKSSTMMQMVSSITKTSQTVWEPWDTCRRRWSSLRSSSKSKWNVCNNLHNFMCFYFLFICSSTHAYCRQVWVCVCVWPSTSSCVLFLYNIVNIECQWRKWKTKRFSSMDLYIFLWIISVKTQICAAEENVNRDCIDCWISAINLKRL